MECFVGAFGRNTAALLPPVIMLPLTHWTGGIGNWSVCNEKQTPGDKGL